MASNPLAEIRSIRLGKAQTLREMGLNPFPSKSGRTHYAGKILEEFATLNALSKSSLS